MSYIVLARKYRSLTFDDVVGQQPIARTLKNAITTGKIAHAFLFTGTRGIGKTTMARILAKSLNCLASDKPTTAPCCKCESCLAVHRGDDVDVIEIDGASNNGVEEVRRLRENAIYRPARARFKIYIIDEVHMLTTSAFNALLKILEEPPEHVKFIFATTEPNKVLATIQSRCQRFDFNNISAKEIAEHLANVLKQEKIDYEDDLLLFLAKMAGGSMRDGLSLLDRLISTGTVPLTIGLIEQFLGCPDSEKICRLVEKIGASDAAGTLRASEALVNSGLSEVQLVDALVDYFRDLMVVKSAGSDTELIVVSKQQRKQLTSLAEFFDTAALVYNITALEKLRWTVKNSRSGRALLEACLLRFALSEHFLNVDVLLNQSKAAGSNPAKKKRAPVTDPLPPTPANTNEQPADLSDVRDLAPLKGSWPEILRIVSVELGNGTASLLSRAEPTEFKNCRLKLEFTNSTTKNLFETNSRPQKVQALLSRLLGIEVELKLENNNVRQDKPGKKNAGADSRKKNKIISDPSVKTVLTELGATITAIEEKNITDKT